MTGGQNSKNIVRRFQDPILGKFLESHFSILFMPACIVDERNLIVWWNTHAETHTHLRRKDMIGTKNTHSLFDDGIRNIVIDILNNIDDINNEKVIILNKSLQPYSIVFLLIQDNKLPFIFLYGKEIIEYSTFTYYAYDSIQNYNFTVSPSVDLFKLLKSLDRNGDVMFGAIQNEEILYFSRALIDKLYSKETLLEQLISASVFLSMEDSAALDHERTIGSLTEETCMDTILQWPQLSQNKKRVWTQSWPNILTVNGRRANFSLVRDATLEKERSSLFERLLMTKDPVQHEKYVKLLSVFVGQSDIMQKTISKLIRAAFTLVTLSIYGETGTGKTLAAKIVHELSSKAKGAFVYVNCGAIPEELFESAFFGHLKGSFTGAVRDSEGYLTKANNGTLFLDEIAELSLKSQAKLLQALNNKSYTPVGSTKELFSDFRLIVATNRDLRDMVEMGQFREDLFYRINVFEITLPPLKERKDDLPFIINNILRKNNVSFNIQPSMLKMLTRYDWPGNIRELENVIMRLTVEGNLDFFSPSIGKAQKAAQAVIKNKNFDLKQNVALVEKEIILKALEQFHWNRQHTAKELGITRVTLFRKMKEYGITES